MLATAASAQKMREQRRSEQVHFESIECFHYRLGACKRKVGSPEFRPPARSGFHFTAGNTQQVPGSCTFSTRTRLPDYILEWRASKASDGIRLLTCSIPARFGESNRSAQTQRNAISRKRNFTRKRSFSMRRIRLLVLISALLTASFCHAQTATGETLMLGLPRRGQRKYHDHIQRSSQH